MSTRVPKAWETSWAQDAIRTHQAASADAFAFCGDEQKRVDAVLAQAANPAACSAELPLAPARGRVAEFRDSSVVPVDSDGFEIVEERYKAGCAGRVRDNFDEMTDQALRRNAEPPFTVLQVHAARMYRALHERIEGSNLKCATAFDVPTGNGSGRDVMDAFIRSRERLAMFHAAIGDGVAMDTRRKLKQSNGDRVRITDADLARSGRKIITVRRLVDDVCLRERSLSDVLRGHGWGVKGKNRDSLRAALCLALGRMQGI